MKSLAIQTNNAIMDMTSLFLKYPNPEHWTDDQKAQAVQFASLVNTSSQIIASAVIAGIDWTKERETFIANAGREKSRYTRTAYTAGLNRLEAYAERIKINPLALTPAQADDFIYAMQTEGYAPAYVNRNTAACSSFYTFLERRHEGIKNPFRGTKARPVKKPVRKTEIPGPAELQTILANLPPMETAMVSVMAYRGLRAGALPALSLKGNRYTSHSKGKDITGTLPQEVLDAVKNAGLDPKNPFAVNRDGNPMTVLAIETRIRYHIGKLFKAGKISALYSCHDFRHYYAVTLYRETKDIHKVSKLLSHASIQVTETYLKGLGEYDAE